MNDQDQADAIAAYAEVIKHMLKLVPEELRGRALETAAAEEQRAAQERATGHPLIVYLLDPAVRQRIDDYRRRRPLLFAFKAATVCAFIRDITNNHNPQDAARLLFANHHGLRMPGSGWLADYLGHLPACASMPASSSASPPRQRRLEQQQMSQPVTGPSLPAISPSGPGAKHAQIEHSGRDHGAKAKKSVGAVRHVRHAGHGDKVADWSDPNGARISPRASGWWIADLDPPGLTLTTRVNANVISA
jgi:hypothetical protein